MNVFKKVRLLKEELSLILGFERYDADLDCEFDINETFVYYSFSDNYQGCSPEYIMDFSFDIKDVEEKSIDELIEIGKKMKNKVFNEREVIALKRKIKDYTYEMKEAKEKLNEYPKKITDMEKQIKALEKELNQNENPKELWKVVKFKNNIVVDTISDISKEEADKYISEWKIKPKNKAVTRIEICKK